jgi:hypothetical protein
VNSCSSAPLRVVPSGTAPTSKTHLNSFRDATFKKLELKLTIQRVYQDLQEEYSDESVKRYVRKLARRR